MNDKQIILELGMVLAAIEVETQNSSIAIACRNVLGRTGLTHSIPTNGVDKVLQIMQATRDVGAWWEQVDTMAERWAISDKLPT